MTMGFFLGRLQFYLRKMQSVEGPYVGAPTRSWVRDRAHPFTAGGAQLGAIRIG